FVLQELGVEESSITPTTGEPIERLGLPTRIVNVLRRNGIITIQELTSYTREELLERVSGLGEQSLQMIEERMRELGYYFREEWGE
ncbi:MAG: DNA-directed RNA polymerase subunit alpha C-terminal domain-containing protein, partial [Armatimonadota bacterium]|nr:DNA-directed RNA polymerase subunit alpha [Armatimonadota bacterium]MDW8144586.1 DNA-directed RNA polymerase subunit alpha C-terminal domain-containing protein [Armatimonadota bacterium]